MQNPRRLVRWPPAASLSQANGSCNFVLFPPSPFRDHTTNFYTVDINSSEATSASFVTRSTTLLDPVDLLGALAHCSPNCSKEWLETITPKRYSYRLELVRVSSNISRLGPPCELTLGSLSLHSEINSHSHSPLYENHSR
jgi:hypothetical protein